MRHDIPCLVLSDLDLEAHLTMADAVEVIEAALVAHGQGRLVAPPRYRVEAPGGGLAFTAGATPEAIGFRVYDLYPSSSTDKPQVVASFSTEDGMLEGLVVGSALGAMRTAAIGGVAIRHLASPRAAVLGVIGAGFQSRHQIEAALAARSGWTTVVLASRTPDKARALAEATSEAHPHLEVRCLADNEEVVRASDVVLCATNSRSPVVDKRWLSEGMHLSTIGPKLRGASELPADIVDAVDLVVADAPAQIEAYGAPFFLPTPEVDIVALGDVVRGAHGGRADERATTLFCSLGLAGTEVALAHELIARVGAS